MSSHKASHGRSAAMERGFSPGERVVVRDYRQGHDRWIPAVVNTVLGAKTYEVQCDGGGVWRRQSDQINRNPQGMRDEKLDDDFCYQEGMQAIGPAHGRGPEVAGRSAREGPAMSPGTARATESNPVSKVPTTSPIQTPEGGGGGKSFHC